MSRPTTLVGIVLDERFDLGVIEFVGRHDAVFVGDFEKNDRHHQGAGEVPGMACARQRSLGAEPRGPGVLGAAILVVRTQWGIKPPGSDPGASRHRSINTMIKAPQRRIAPWIKELGSNPSGRWANLAKLTPDGGIKRSRYGRGVTMCSVVEVADAVELYLFNRSSARVPISISDAIRSIRNLCTNCELTDAELGEIIARCSPKAATSTSIG
jgi:hypothetical protein